MPGINVIRYLVGRLRSCVKTPPAGRMISWCAGLRRHRQRPSWQYLISWRSPKMRDRGSCRRTLRQDRRQRSGRQQRHSPRRGTDRGRVHHRGGLSRHTGYHHPASILRRRVPRRRERTGDERTDTRIQSGRGRVLGDCPEVQGRRDVRTASLSTVGVPSAPERSPR